MKTALRLAGLALAACAAVLLGLFVGGSELPAQSVAWALLHPHAGGDVATIVWQLRAPRVTIAALAATRRQIGRARDLDVMAVRLERLAPPAEVAEPLKAAIIREREAAQRARRGLSATAPRARLGAIKKRLEGWDLSEIGTEEIVAAVARTYRQARRRGRLGFESDDPQALHAFRARVVDLRYQLALISCAWPEALDSQAEALDELREALGDHHYLYVLAGFAAERGGLGPEALDRLHELVREKQKKLRRRGKKEFERLFAETPAAFAARLAAYLARPIIKPTMGVDEAERAKAAPIS